MICRRLGERKGDRLLFLMPLMVVLACVLSIEIPTLLTEGLEKWVDSLDLKNSGVLFHL